MENKAKKMFAAVAVIMLCAVAIVGVGYAYTATTTNSGNYAQSEHVVLTQANSAYTFVKNEAGYNQNYTVYYDTENTGPTDNKYILKNGETTAANAPEITGIKYDTDKKFYGLQLGKDNTLTAAFTGDSEKAPEAYPVTISSKVAPNAPTGWYVIVVFENSGAYQYALYGNGGTAWTYYGSTGTSQPCIVLDKNGSTGSQVYNVKMYYAAKAAGSETFGSSTTAPDAKPLNNADISFSYSHRAILANKVIALSGSSTTLEVTKGTDDDSSGTINAYSLNTGIVTVGVSENTVTITKAAAGQSTYIVCTVTVNTKVVAYEVAKVTTS